MRFSATKVEPVCGGLRRRGTPWQGRAFTYGGEGHSFRAHWAPDVLRCRVMVYLAATRLASPFMHFVFHIQLREKKERVGEEAVHFLAPPCR
jgi:hypothetical protein